MCWTTWGNTPLPPSCVGCLVFAMEGAVLMLWKWFYRSGFFSLDQERGVLPFGGEVYLLLAVLDVSEWWWLAFGLLFVRCVVLLLAFSFCLFLMYGNLFFIG